MTSQANGMQKEKRRAWFLSVRFYAFMLSLLQAILIWTHLPSLLHGILAPQDIFHLYTLWLPWPVWSRLNALDLIGLAVGLVVICAGILLQKNRMLLLGLIAIAPNTIIALLYLPDQIAVFQSFDHTDQMYNTLIRLQSLRIIYILLGVVYFFWVWWIFRRWQTDAVASPSSHQSESPLESTPAK
jgi:hypothetical protein